MPRRPGITFETVTPSPPETLPRMDIAAFVGFATRGPIDVPVPVEDIARFRDVFGPPLTLVRDREAGRTKRAHLHRAVEAFFRNGGRRCWVVRVAQPVDEASAGGPVERTSFGLPGLVSAETGQPSTVRARCYGATFDELRVGTLLRRRLLPAPSSVSLPETNGDGPGEASGLTLSWSVERPDLLAEEGLTSGDLLRLRVAESRDDPSGENDRFSKETALVAYAAVASRTRKKQTGAAAPTPLTERNGPAVAVRTGPVHVFKRVPDRLALSRGQIEKGAPIPASRRVGVDLEVQGAAGPSAKRSGATLVRVIGDSYAEEEPPRFRLVVDPSEIPTGDGRAGLETRCVHVLDNDDNRLGYLRLGPERRSGANRVEYDVRDALWTASDEDLEGLMSGGDVSVGPTEQLEFDLLAWRDQELQTRLNHLGFAESHPRAWTDLPVDASLFAVEEGETVTPEPDTLRAGVFEPRFPLAGPEVPGEGPFVPLGMTDRPDPNRTRGRTASAGNRGSRLERERLATFSTDVFVDSALSGTATANLGEKADDKIYVDQRPVSGLHTLWPVREATLLAVPDAVHRGWDEPRTVTPDALPEPSPLNMTVDPDAEPPRIHLSWTVDRLGEDGVAVEVQEAREPTFEDPVVRYRGSESSVNRYVRRNDPVTLFFRYRVVADGQPEPWSDTRSASLPEPDFDACARRPGVPSVARIGTRWFTWGLLPEPAESALTYELQIDRTPAFEAPVEVSPTVLPPADTPPDVETIGGYEPSELSNLGIEGAGDPIDLDPRSWYKVPISPDTPAVRYVRLRARRDIDDHTLVGGWSRTVPFVHDLKQRKSCITTREYDDPETDTPGGGRGGLLDVQRAMLRFGAARGDVLSVLALPETDQPEDARRHATRLRTPGATLDYGEERTLSYGALYYPWLLGPVDGGARIAPMPPDGAACGMIADRTLRDGAWMAPANIALADVPTVVPPLTSDDRADLGTSSINVFAETPDGVLTLGTATLARDPDLEPIPTRRLLILVRRLVRREGPALVFENNTPLLRRRIAEQLDDVLRRLFDRGAFAGATPSEGYRIVADESVNPPRQVERGRLVVELRIAPARPLTFLTVRLVQRSGQRPAVSEPGTGGG
ncbi:MAG: hypothetical protein ABEL97_05130 [Salinibacter sp.]